MLTEKDRLKKAIRKEAVDRPPCICPGGMMNIVTREMMEAVEVYLPEAHSDAVKMAALAKAAYTLDCFENYGLPFCMTVEAEAMGAEVDIGSLVCEPHVVGYAIEKVEDWRRLSALDCGKGRAGTVLGAIRLLKQEDSCLPIIGNLTGPVSLAASLIEPVVFYKALRRNKEESHAFMEFVTAQLAAFGRAQLAAGADVIAISDPSGTGEIMGPRLFREYATVYLNRLIHGLRQARPDVDVIVHICGKMHTVYDSLAEVDAGALSFDAVVSLRKTVSALPNKAIMGNTSTYAIEFSTPANVARLTKGCIRAGADIIAPACGMGNNSPLANIRALRQAVLEEALCTQQTRKGETSYAQK